MTKMEQTSIFHAGLQPFFENAESAWICREKGDSNVGNARIQWRVGVGISDTSSESRFLEFTNYV